MILSMLLTSKKAILYCNLQSILRFPHVDIRHDEHGENAEYIVNYNTKGLSGGPREGQVGVMLGSSWHLQGI